MAVTARLAGTLLLSLLLLAASSNAAAAGRKKAQQNGNKAHDCKLESPTAAWSMHCSDAGACSVTLPSGSYTEKAKRITCVLALKGKHAELFKSFASLLAARPTLADACDKYPYSPACKEIAPYQVRTTTVKVKSTDRNNELTLAFTPNVYVLPSTWSILNVIHPKSKDYYYVACVQKPASKKSKCIDEDYVPVREW